jgi:signal transduction histidine kinase
VVNYSRLPAGSYTFQVTACNNSGVWNTTGATLSFVVAPFPWQTWWFRLGTGGALLILLGTTIRVVERRRIKRQLEFLERQHAVERERIRIARDIHDELGAGLTQIGLLADLGTSRSLNQDGVRLNLQKIEGRARAALMALDEIVWAVNPRNDNLTRLADYLCHIADECFESGPIRCRKDVPTGLPPVVVATELRHNLTLAVKEALTNVLKHSAANTVWLRLRWNMPELAISVEDNGVGFDPGTPRSAASSGLRNQTNRMKDIGGTVDITSVPGRGTHVEFRVRLRGHDPTKPVAQASHEPN